MQKKNRESKTVESYVVMQFLASGKKAVLVEGIDAAGKTWFSKKIKHELNKYGLRSCIVGVDEFLADRNSRIVNGVSSWHKYLNTWFDINRLHREILLPFSSCQEMNKNVAVYNEKSGISDKIRKIKISNENVLILEGVFLSRGILRSFPAFRVLLEVPFGLSEKRQLRREPIVRNISKDEALNRWMKWHLPAQKYYLSHWKPRNLADIVIDNSDYHSPKIIKMR